MCINYATVKKNVVREAFEVDVPEAWEWEDEVWQDHVAPIIVDRGNGPAALLASYGMIPQHRQPEGVRISTLNARAETIGSKRSYKEAWLRSQLCLVPMEHYYEPCYEAGHAERWSIGLASGEPFAVAGLVQKWKEKDGSESYSFTQLTINADSHSLMSRMHKPGDEKRSLVIVPQSGYDDWLACKNPEIARAMLQPFPAGLMQAHRVGRYGKR